MSVIVMIGISETKMIRFNHVDNGVRLANHAGTLFRKNKVQRMGEFRHRIGSANYMHIQRIEPAAAFMKSIREISNIRSGVDLSIEL